MDKQTIFKNTILRGVVGSTALGTNLPGTDDQDEMGVCIEPTSYVLGLNKFEHYIQRDQPEGVRSQPGDLDLTIYSLRKFCYLATQGNPSIVALLWLPNYIIKSVWGERLLGLRKAFISTEAGKRFLGYLTAQRMALVGERAPKVQRPELVEQFGYDTKFAMHALRLGQQGIEYLTEGQLTLPLPESERRFLLDVRLGKFSKAEVVAEIDNRRTKLLKLVENTIMLADKAAINTFLVDVHLDFWRNQ